MPKVTHHQKDDSVRVGEVGDEFFNNLKPLPDKSTSDFPLEPSEGVAEARSKTPGFEGKVWGPDTGGFNFNNIDNPSKHPHVGRFVDGKHLRSAKPEEQG